MVKKVIRAIADSAELALRRWRLLTPAGRRRSFRLAALILLYPVLAYGAGTAIAAAWLGTVATCELALSFVQARRARALHTPHDVGAAIGAALLANLVWTAGPISLWLCAPGLGGPAALWLAGHVFYHFIANRRSLSAFAVGAAPHAAAVVIMHAASTWGAPDFYAATTPALLLMTMALGAAAQRHAPAPEEGAAAQTPAGAILFIGEDPKAREILEAALAPWGLALRAFSTAHAGLMAAPALAPSLIVLDARLPDLSGWDALAALKAAPGTAAIPALLLSEDDDRARALALGAADHFRKPADRTLLAAAVLRCARFPQPAPAAKPRIRVAAKTA